MYNNLFEKKSIMKSFWLLMTISNNTGAGTNYYDQ
jgi:hypothetical protein